MRLHVLFNACVVILLVSGCGTATPSPAVLPTVTITATPDPCSVEAIAGYVQQANDLMREYDDTTYVANLTLQTQLGDMILKLQDVRRRTEDIVLPICLAQLKQNEIGYMNSVIQYLAAFMAGGDRTQVTEMIKNTQNLRVSYETEKQRLSGSGTSEAETTPTLTANEVVVKNPGSHALNLDLEPTLSSKVEKLMKPGESAPALARDSDSKWILVDYEGERLWIYASLVALVGSMDALPVMAAPTPTSQG